MINRKPFIIPGPWALCSTRWFGIVIWLDAFCSYKTRKCQLLRYSIERTDAIMTVCWLVLIKMLTVFSCIWNFMFSCRSAFINFFNVPLPVNKHWFSVSNFVQFFCMFDKCVVTMVCDDDYSINSTTFDIIVLHICHSIAMKNNSQVLIMFEYGRAINIIYLGFIRCSTLVKTRIKYDKPTSKQLSE